MAFRLNGTVVSIPLIISVGVAVFCSTSLSQAVSGDLAGSVYDGSGAVAPKVLLIAINTATNMKSSAVTNGSGQYRLSISHPAPTM